MATGLTAEHLFFLALLLAAVTLAGWIQVSRRRRAAAAAECRQRRLAAEIVRRQRSLEDHRRRLQAVIDAAPIVLLSIDPEGIVTCAEGRGLMLLGGTAGDIVGRPVFDVYRRYPALLRHVRQGLAGRSAAAVLRLGDWTFDTVFTPTHAAGSVGPGLIVVARDITQRRSLEAQLVQSQRMEAVGRLSGGVTHDFSNALTAIMGHAAMMSGRLPPAHALGHHLDAIQQSAERAAAITRQLQIFTRRHVAEPRVLDVNETVRALEKMLRRLIGEDVELQASLLDAPMRVKIDPVQIEQVVLSLVFNARDAMPRGGKLTVETAEVALDSAFVALHPGLSAGAHVLLSVSDSGCGIDAALQQRVFEPFFTTKRSDRADGLGLSTARHIVREAGGCIELWSQKGRGTTFNVYLPLARPAAVESLAPVRTRAPRATVLLVEDETAVRVLVEEVLRREGYDVLIAADGRRALELAAGHDGRIDLMLSDVVMPEMSGVQLAPLLKHRRPEMRVLYMSGYTDEPMLDQGIFAPGIAFLEKPFSPSSLARKIREVLEQPTAA